MSRLFSNRDRHFDMGMLPTELLARDASAPPLEARVPGDARAVGPDGVNQALAEYQVLFAQYLAGEPARARAPLPGDLGTRSRTRTASANFLDVSPAGVCGWSALCVYRLPSQARGAQLCAVPWEDHLAPRRSKQHAGGDSASMHLPIREQVITINHVHHQAPARIRPLV